MAPTASARLTIAGSVDSFDSSARAALSASLRARQDHKLPVRVIRLDLGGVDTRSGLWLTQDLDLNEELTHSELIVQSDLNLSINATVI